MSPAALVLCPGRGSYTAADLGYLSRPAPAAALTALGAALDRCDDVRAARGDAPIRDLDGGGKFSADFLRGENAAGLTFACTAFDFLRLDGDAIDIVAVGGNSMGWYSALFAAGVFSLDDTFDLVETMGGLTRDRRAGGQLIYPVVDADWVADAERIAAVDTALAATRAAGHEAGWSIRYGGFAVLWADDGGLEALSAALPAAKSGAREYPLQLPQHAAFHSPLMRQASTRALEQLAHLPWRAPRRPLIDGNGKIWEPLSTNPEALRRYTLDAQVTTTFDFATTARVALRECAPDIVVLLGPGDTLGAAVAHTLIAEKWQGIDSREAFFERQQDDPFLLAMARPEQAARVILPAG